MRIVDLKILEEKLGELIGLVTRGETILVMDGGRVVAELVPPRERHTASPDAELGPWLTPPLLVEKDPPTGLPVAPLHEILRELDDERADR